jgi:ribose transport system substrate-binding protein
MSYVGNDWMNEMENLVKAVATSDQYKKITTLRVDIAGPSVPKQIQQINNEVRAGMDAIVVYPISPTALNVAIRNACTKGVVVVSFNATVTEPCAYVVKTSDVQFGYEQGMWIAKLLHGKGNIVTITGVSGVSADIDRLAGLDLVLKKYPGLKVIASGNGMWDQAISKQVFTRILAAHPTGIQAVWAEVGCPGVESVLIEKKKPLIPCAGEGENGFRVMMLPKSKGGMGLPGISVSAPSYLGELGFINAVRILKGEQLKKYMKIPLPKVTNSQLRIGTDPAKGANVLVPPISVSPGFFMSFWSPMVTQGLNAVLTGRPETVSAAKACSAVPGCEQSDNLSVFQHATGATVPS